MKASAALLAGAVIACAALQAAAPGGDGEGKGKGKAMGLGQGAVKGQTAAGVPVQAQGGAQQQYVQVPVQQAQQPLQSTPQPQYVQVPAQQAQPQYVQVPAQQAQPQYVQVPVQQAQQQYVQVPVQQAQQQGQQRAPASNTASKTRGPGRTKPCGKKPCQNGAVCTNVRSKSGNPYTCVCKKGWEGVHCEQLQTSIHLDADLMLKSEDGQRQQQAAVVDGVVQPAFAEPNLDFAVNQDHVVITLKNTGELPLDFKQPHLIPQFSEVLSPALVGSARKGGRLGRGDQASDSPKSSKSRLGPTRDLSVSHNCLLPGKTSKVQLLLEFQSGNLTFGWTVTCPKAASDGLTIVMKGIEDKVYEKGSVSRMFAPTSDRIYEAPGNKNVTSFILFACDPKQAIRKGKGKKKGCPNPIAMNRPKVKSDYTAAASPVIVGQAAKGGTVDMATEVAVKHNCHDFGDARITLTLIFKSYDPIELTWRVSCYGGKPAGLMVTLGKGSQADAVVTNGDVAPAWARDTTQAVIGGDTRFTAFRIFSTNKKAKMTFQQAQVTANNDVCNPGLSGQYWKGASVGYKGGVNRLKNAFGKNPKLGKIVEQITGKPKAEKPATDGIERRLSQMDSHERMWETTTDNDEIAVVVEQEGMLSDLQNVDRRRAAQSIVGHAMDVASKFGDLSELSASESIIVTYNCVAKGTSLLTLTIPFVMYDPIELQWHKECGGGTREYFTVRSDEQLVVEDGLALDHWHPLYAQDSGKIIDAAKTETTFTIQMAEDPKALKDDNVPLEQSYLDEYVDFFVEDTYTNTGHAISHALNLVQTFGRPRIQSSNKQICRPSLSGTARNGGTASATPQDLTVKYNCLGQGDAVITVTIPVGVYLDAVFSFTKRCNRDPIKGFMMVPKDSSKRVVTNGIAEKAYQAQTSGGYIVLEGMTVYPRANKTANFLATMSRGSAGVTYQAPMVYSSPSICEPRFDGDMAHGGVLSPMKPLSMIIRFNCQTAGTAVITVRIEPEDDTLDAVEFSIVKDNGGTGPTKGLVTHSGVFKAIGLVLFAICVLGACCVYWAVRAQRGEYNSSYAASSYTGGGSSASGSWKSTSGGSSGGGNMQPMKAVTSANEYS